MAHVLYLYDGSSTIYLTDNTTNMLSNYVPRTPKIESAQQSSNEDGGEVNQPRYKNVTETIEIVAIGANGAAVQTNVQNIQRMMHTARDRQKTKSGPKVYLVIQLDSDTVTWRSEVLYGELDSTDDTLKIWGNFQVPKRLTITRRYFWEWETATTTSISSQATAATTTGVTIHNHKDSGHGNYIEIAAAALPGVLPAPIKLELKNSTGSSQNYTTFHFATNAFSDPANFDHIIEGGDVVSGTGTVTGGTGTCSNDDYVSATFTSYTFQFVITAAQLVDTAGRVFRILARFHDYTASPAIYVRPVLMDTAGLVDLVLGDEIKLPVVSGSNFELVDLGSLQLPPDGYNADYGPMTLAIRMRSATSVTVDLDYIQLTPTDSYRVIKAKSVGVANNSFIYDDGLEDQVYSGTIGTFSPVFSKRGEPLVVYPGRINRIYILHDEGFSSDIANSFVAKVYYRARRLTL